MNASLVTLTRRATVMQTQVDVLEGKLKALARFRDAMGQLGAELDGLAAADGAGAAKDGPAEASPGGAGAAAPRLRVSPRSCRPALRASC